MKIGICTSPENAVLLNGAPDYVELNLTNLTKMTVEEFKSARNLLSSNGISAEASNCFFPGDIKLCGDDLDEKVVMEYTKTALDRASQIGIHTCVLGSGAARMIPDGADAYECQKQLDEIFYKIGECAKVHNITVVIEPLNTGETNVITSVSQGADMAKRVNHPSIKLLADLYHVALENETYDAIAQNGDLLRHVHIANPNGRTFPICSDEYDYLGFKNALVNAKYDLRISIEGSAQGDYVKTATQSLEFLKNFFK